MDYSEIKYSEMVKDATTLFEQENAEVLLFGTCLGFFGGDWENFGTNDQRFVNKYSVWVEGDRTFNLDYETGVLNQMDMLSSEAEIIYSNM